MSLLKCNTVCGKSCFLNISVIIRPDLSEALKILYFTVLHCTTLSMDPLVRVTAISSTNDSWFVMFTLQRNVLRANKQTQANKCSGSTAVTSHAVCDPLVLLSSDVSNTQKSGSHFRASINLAAKLKEGQFLSLLHQVGSHNIHWLFSKYRYIENSASLNRSWRLASPCPIWPISCASAF